jgi:hypothetical protein
MPVAAGSVVERFCVVEDVGSSETTRFVDLFRMLSFFRLLENDSATAFPSN